MKIKRGSTSVRRLIFVADSTSAVGAGLTGLAHNTSGLVAYYFAGDLSNEVQITLASATLGSYTSGGWVAVDNTNMPGWYEVGIPDAALDGGNEVAIQYRGATNMVPVNIYIELDAVDYQSATTFGLSKFGDIEADTQDIQSRLPSALVSGRIDASVGAMAANTVTASALATDAVTEIQSGLALESTVTVIAGYLDTEIAAIKAKTDLITTDTVFVTVDRVAGSTITMHYAESTTATVPLDEDTTSLTLRFIVENSDQLDVLVIENASITRTASNFAVTITTAVTATLGQYRWALRDITGGINRHIEGGVLQVISAANKDA
jgi:hypothetical protein